MPPHYNQVEPAPGGELLGDTITISGYTLMAADAPVVTDLTTHKKLSIDIEWETQRVGRGLKMKEPPPGSIQTHTIMRVKLPEVPAGHQVKIEFLGDVLVWTQGAPDGAAKALPVLTTTGALAVHVGETVRLIGEAANSKAGPLLIDSREQTVGCSGEHWPDELLGKQIEAVVVVTAASTTAASSAAASPTADFPIATQNADGEWTQGVGGPDPAGLLDQSGLAAPAAQPTSIVLTIESYSVLVD